MEDLTFLCVSLGTPEERPEGLRSSWTRAAVRSWTPQVFQVFQWFSIGFRSLACDLNLNLNLSGECSPPEPFLRSCLLCCPPVFSGDYRLDSWGSPKSLVLDLGLDFWFYRSYFLMSERCIRGNLT